MCGICGISGSFDSRGAQREGIIQMIAPLTHRGPDGWGIYLSPGAALGHTRLAIFDLLSGHQPMIGGRYAITYNGEVYNHYELKKELEKEGVSFRTTCDTEVILKAHEQWGLGAVTRFNGQFAYLLWDRKEQKLIAFRDRYGIRPLYILNQRGRFYFSSEMKSFDTIPGYRRELDGENLFEHALLWNTLEDRTIYRGIRSLPGGTMEIYSSQGLEKSWRWYTLGEDESPSTLSMDEASEEFSGLLEDAVRLRLRSDVPVACYLSGGVDSSVITYLTAKIQKEKFKTFSVSFEDKEFDESVYQEEMARQLNAEHFDLKISDSHIAAHFEEALYHTERPIFRTAPVPLYLLSRRVREAGIKVVLTGEAADEILWGYDSYKELKFLRAWSHRRQSACLPELLKSLYPHLNHYADPRYFGLMKMFYEDFLDSYDNDLVGLNIRVSNNKILKNYFLPELGIEFNLPGLLDKVRRMIPERFDSWSLLKKNQYLEMESLLKGYLLSSQGDRMSMAHSVEGRYPFLDHRVVEKVFSYRDNMKLKGFSQKHLLRKAFAPYIPDSIINRPKRPYMAPDLKAFFPGKRLSSRSRELLSPGALAKGGLFSSKPVTRFINKFEGKEVGDTGYRDNMVMIFLLSTQAIALGLGESREINIDEEKKNIEIEDF